jgi:hypothetical protein
MKNAIRKSLMPSVLAWSLLLAYSFSHANQIKIIADRISYTPILSSTVGIGLMPSYTSKDKSIKYHWKTSYGEFLDWSSADSKVHELGADVTNNGQKIFWTYDPRDMGKNKPQVKIFLTVEDASGRIADASTIELIWEHHDVARIKSVN